MSDITVERSASGVSVEPLREQVRGQVLTADDAGYDEARTVHNGMFDKRPLAVLAPSRWRRHRGRELRPRERTRSVRPAADTADPASAPTTAVW